MATLDVLDYAVSLDERLAADGAYRAAERKLLLRDVRHLVEDLAFRFAFMEGRVLPEDVDYARALEALKPAARASQALTALRPRYAKRVRRKRVTTYSTLVVVGLVVVAFANFVTSERADVLVDAWQEGARAPASVSLFKNFTVTEGTVRVQYTAHVVVFDDKSDSRANTITFTIVDPDGAVRAVKEFTSANAVYAKGAIEGPHPGVWTVYLDYHDAVGSSDVSILGVHTR